MNYTKILGRFGDQLVFVLSALLAVALAATPQGTSAASQTKGVAPHTKTMPSMANEIASKPRPAASNGRDLLVRLDGKQKELQRQLQTLTGTIQRRSDELDRRIDTLTNQSQRLASAQQLSMQMQQRLTATVRSMQRLLIIIVGLLLVICGALVFFGFQAKQFGLGSLFKKRRRIDAARTEAPDRALETQWKV
jgi:predicted PurR-regulated permease PerM